MRLASVYRTKADPNSRTSRLICAFGLPLAGTSTVVRVLCEATEVKTIILQDLEEEAIAQAFDNAEIVFIDPFEPSVEAVQWLYDNKYMSAADAGCIVQVWAPDDVLLKRAYNAERTLDVEMLRQLRWDIEPVEERIRQLGISYYTIPNNQDLERTVANLARRVGITSR